MKKHRENKTQKDRKDTGNLDIVRYVVFNCFTVEEGCKNKRLKSLPFLYSKDKYSTKEIRTPIEFRNTKKKFLRVKLTQEKVQKFKTENRKILKKIIKVAEDGKTS